MSQGQTPITVIGNAVADPELRYTPSGSPVANFRIASTPRRFNRDRNQWEDGDPLFLEVTCWKQLGEHVAATVHKGQRVIVNGNLQQREFTTRDGDKRSSYGVIAEDVGPSLLFATAEVSRDRGGNAGSSGGSVTQGGGSNDPWSSAPSSAPSASEEPPF